MARSETTQAPRVCRGCGCTDEDGCLVEVYSLWDGPWIETCHWVKDDLCSGCRAPEYRLRGPLVDHRVAAPAGTGADAAAPAGECR